MLKRLTSQEVESILVHWESMSLKQLEKMEVEFYHILDNNQGNTLMCEVIQDQLILLHDEITKRLGDQL